MYVCVYFYTASLSPLLLRGGPDNSPQAGVSEFHAEAQWACVVSKGLAQGPVYAMARGGVRTRDLSIHDQRRYLGATAPHAEAWY